MNPFFFLFLSLSPILVAGVGAGGDHIRVHNRKAGFEYRLLAPYHFNDSAPLDRKIKTVDAAYSTLGTTSQHRKRGAMARAFVNEHNAVRAKLGLPQVAWDKKVARYARQWARKIASTGCVMKHSMGPYGENVFWGGGNQWTPADAVKLWVSEAPDYDIKLNECAATKVCGHYTQVVWKESVRLGCDRVECPSGDVFITCNYDPPGNYIGERPF